MDWGLLPKTGKLRCPNCGTMVTLYYEPTERHTKQICRKCGWTKTTDKHGEQIDGHK